MSIVLKHQVEASNRSADELLRAGHGDAMSYYDVRDLLDSFVANFEKAVASVERRRSEAEAGLAKDPAGSPQWDTIFREWDAVFRQMERGFPVVARLVREAEALGFVIEGKQRFEEAWAELRRITCFDYDRTAAAVAQARQGRLTPLGELRDGLPDRAD